MKILLRIYLVLFFVIFSFSNIVSAKDSLPQDLSISKYQSNYIIETPTLESYIILPTQNCENNILPDLDRNKTYVILESNDYFVYRNERKNDNIIALLFSTEVFPHAP